MSKIIYIAGLGHSGSTILDMSLATLPGVIGLGELKTLLDDDIRGRHLSSLCSCGKIGTECDFWKEYSKNIDAGKDECQKYEIVLELLRKIYGKDTILVDSSKNSYAYLKYLNDNHDLKVLFLTRDIRSWSYSRSLSTKKPLLYYFTRWFLENKKLQHQIRKMGISYFKLGYEETALYPEKVFQDLCDFSGVVYSDQVLVPDHTNSHIISGNIARADKMKRSKWIYDARWMLSRKILFYSPILLLFRKMNKKYVYSNISGNRIANFYLFGTSRKEELSTKYN